MENFSGPAAGNNIAVLLGVIIIGTHAMGSCLKDIWLMDGFGP